MRRSKILSVADFLSLSLTSDMQRRKTGPDGEAISEKHISPQLI